LKQASDKLLPLIESKSDSGNAGGKIREMENQYIPEDDEEELPGILLPDEFDQEVERALTLNSFGEDEEVSAPPLLVPEKLYDIIAERFAKRVWVPVVSAIRANSRLYVKYSNELVTKYNPLFEDNHIQFHYKKLEERVHACLEKLVYLDREMNEDLTDESPNNHFPIQAGDLPTDEATKKPRKTRMSVEKRFEQFCITRTGKKEDPYITEYITSNTILIDALKIILPISAIEILASWLIQASQKDAATALIFGLLYVLGSTSAFVVSAYYEAIAKGHKAYKEAFETNFATNGDYVDPDTGEKLTFFTLPPGIKTTARATFWSGLTVLLLGFIYRLYIVLTSQDGWVNHIIDLLAIVIIVVTTITVYHFKSSSFPQLPLNELTQYYNLRKKVPRLLTVSWDVRKEANELKSEEDDASTPEPSVDANPPQFQMSPNNDGNGEVKYEDIRTLWQVKRYYLQQREKLFEEIRNDLQQRDILTKKIKSRLDAFDQSRIQASSLLNLKWEMFHYKLAGGAAKRNGNSSPVGEEIKKSFIEVYLALPPEYTELKQMHESIVTPLLNSSLPIEINVEEKYNELKRKNHKPPYRYAAGDPA
jgi:hypothetical protein